MLAHYQQFFDTVEVNNSFYQLPKRPALETWHNSTPPDFCFSVKGSRFLTHMKKLQEPEQGLERFLSSVEVLQQKLGPILFQLPPNWELDVLRLRNFIQHLPAQHRYGFEFRNATWNVTEIYELLAQHNMAYCIFDLAGFESPIETTADFSYVRLHGPGGKYQGIYTEAALRKWAKRILGWKEQGRAVYVYFDNDQAGYAAENALSLKRLLS